MISIRKIYWIAGLLEGEGCFNHFKEEGRYTHPKIILGMSDDDVIIKAALILEPKSIGQCINNGHNSLTRPHYKFQLGGKQAIAWMMTLYPLMGKRRRAKIIEIVTAWRQDKLDRKLASLGLLPVSGDIVIGRRTI